MSPSSLVASVPGPRLLPGLCLAGVVASVGAVAAAVADACGLVLGPMPWALLAGLLLANLQPLPNTCAPGVAFAARPLLRGAIVLSGLRLGLAPLAAVGWDGLAALAAIVVGTLAIGRWLGRRLGLGPDLVWLLAAGHAICGAAAIVAADSVLRTRSREVALALTLVTFGGTVLMLLSPLLGEALAMPVAQYGLWVGGSLHEVAQAVAAGHARGEPFGEAATAVKMVRVLFLVPLGLWLVLERGRSTQPGARRWLVPWFVVAFVAVGGLAAAGLVPATMAAPLRGIGTVMMTTAMAALGLQSPLREVAAAGARPLLLTMALTLSVSALAFAAAGWR
jgi:uncharacterized integral membrane protein (TIGR00698 family)